MDTNELKEMLENPQEFAAFLDAISRAATRYSRDLREAEECAQELGMDGTPGIPSLVQVMCQMKWELENLRSELAELKGKESVLLSMSVDRESPVQRTLVRKAWIRKALSNGRRRLTSTDIMSMLGTSRRVAIDLMRAVAEEDEDKRLVRMGKGRTGALVLERFELKNERRSEN